MDTAPPFNDALRELSAFLAEQGHCTELTWVCREDVHFLRRPREKALMEAGLPFTPLIAVRLPLPPENRGIAEAVYEDARRRGLGVRIIALCRLGARAVCYVWGPSDEEDASYSMMPPGTLKLSIRSPFEEALPRTSRIAWALSTVRSRLQGMYRADTFMDVPSRRGAAS